MKQSIRNGNISYRLSFALLAAAVVAFVIMSSLYNLDGDEREHLASSYMVYMGMVPYQDFFQHHHPLIWYLFAPFFAWFGNSSAIYYVMRLLMLFVTAGTGYYLFKIGRILGASAKEMFVGVTIWLSFPLVQKFAAEFRPDNFMMLFCLAGTAYFFAYLQKKRIGLLQLSFGLFFIGLLFLQKTIFILLPLGAICLWLIIRKEMRLSDALKAMVLPFAVTATVIGILYLNGMLKDYWELNWLLNLKIEGTSLVKNGELAVFWPGGLAALWLIGKEKRTDLKVLGWLYLLLVGQMLFHRPWFGQYLLLYYPFLVLVLVFALARFWHWKYHAAILAVALAGLICHNIGVVHKFTRSRLNIRAMAPYTDYILANTKEDDLVLGDAGDIIGGLRLPASGYYWYSYAHMAAMDNYYFKRREMPDFGKIIETKRPKIIINNEWWKCPAGVKEQTDLECVVWRNVNLDYLHQHYDDMGFVYVRKD